MKTGRGLTVARMMELGQVSRAGFYRLGGEAPSGPDPDMELRDAIQRIALEWPSYGRPQITRELRRRGWTVNPKRVYRLMREDNLLCVLLLIELRRPSGSSCGARRGATYNRAVNKRLLSTGERRELVRESLGSGLNPGG